MASLESPSSVKRKTKKKHVKNYVFLAAIQVVFVTFHFVNFRTIMLTFSKFTCFSNPEAIMRRIIVLS